MMLIRRLPNGDVENTPTSPSEKWLMENCKHETILPTYFLPPLDWNGYKCKDCNCAFTFADVWKIREEHRRTRGGIDK
jgi:hypothetical protein